MVGADAALYGLKDAVCFAFPLLKLCDSVVKVDSHYDEEFAGGSWGVEE